MIAGIIQSLSQLPVLGALAVVISAAVILGLFLRRWL